MKINILMENLIFVNSAPFPVPIFGEIGKKYRTCMAIWLFFCQSA